MVGTGLRFGLLGPVSAWRDGVRLELGPGKQVAVLAVLLLNANRPVPPSQLLDAVWGEDQPENGANAVQKAVAGLRRVLEPSRDARSPEHLLTRTEGGYLMRVGPAGLDVTTFRETAARAEAARVAGRLAEAAGLIRSALDLWRAGEPLTGLPGEAFEGHRRHLADAHAEAWETWAEIELATGRQYALVPELLRLVAEHPLRERLRGLLMLALYRCGRQAEALAAYQDARRHLVEEYGVEPGPHLRDLHSQLLRDPSPIPALPPIAAPSPIPAPPPAPAPPTAEPPLRPLLDVPAQRPPLGRWLAWLVPLAVPVLTLGLATWLVTGYHAVRRRSWPLAAATAGWFGLVTVAYLTIDGPASAVGVIAVLIAMGGGAYHAARLGVLPAWQHRLRREQALLLLQHDPALARQLHIGRPDLPRVYDDGGLVDLNAAPERALASLPGMTPDQAHQIVRYRETRGCVDAVCELVAAGLLPRRTPYALRSRLVAIPPAGNVVAAACTGAGY